MYCTATTPAPPPPDREQPPIERREMPRTGRGSSYERKGR